MKNFVKRLLVKALFSKEQRIIIWNALCYSDYRYCRKGNVTRAASVRNVLKDVAVYFGIDKMKFSAKEVSNIVDNVANQVAATVRKQNECRPNSGNVEIVGTVISRSVCEKCNKKNDCIVFDACFKDDEKPAETPENNVPENKLHTDADLTQKEAEEANLVESQGNQNGDEIPVE